MKSSAQSFRNSLEEFDLRSNVVEHILEPLFIKLKYFTHTRKTGNETKSISKTQEEIIIELRQLLQSLDFDSLAIQCNVSFSSDFETAKSDVMDTGEYFHTAVSSFLFDPVNEELQEDVVRASRAMFSALSRLLILADIADLFTLNQKFELVLNGIELIISAKSHKELSTSWHNFYPQVEQLISLSNKRARDLLDFCDRMNVEAANIILMNFTPVLYTTCKVNLRYPEQIGVKDSQKFIASTLSDTVELIQSIMDGSHKSNEIQLKVSGKVLEKLEELENSVFLTCTNSKFPKQQNSNIQDCFKNLLHSIYRLIDSPQIHPSHRLAVIEQCNQVKQTLNELPKVICADDQNNERILHELSKSINNIKQLLIRCAIDQIADSFMIKEDYLMAMSDTTKFGCEQRMDAACQIFQNHSAFMIKAAYNLCSLSLDEDKVSRVQMLCEKIDHLVPHLIHSAYFLFKHPTSRSIEKNYESFCKAYEQLIDQLHQSVNDLVGIHDFLAVIDDIMLLKYQNSIRALSTRDETGLQHASNALQQCATYTCEVMLTKMMARTENLEYVDQVMKKVTLIRDQFSPNFTSTSRELLSHLAAGQPINDKLFRKHGRELCTSIHELRLVTLNELNTSSDFEILNLSDNLNNYELNNLNHGNNNTYYHNEIQNGKHNEYEDSSHPASISDPLNSTEIVKTLDNVFAFLTDEIALTGSLKSSNLNDPKNDVPKAQENKLNEQNKIYAVLTEPQRETMAEQLAGFMEEKKRFMNEIIKWDDSANDIIILAKKMCIIMMEMTDFVRGKGPLRNTMEVIQSAQQISELGEHLDSLCRNIADLCPDSVNRRDLYAYLQRITFYCHQLNITSRVKAGVHMLSDEVFESATSLIQAAKNLMTSVILTIKESYIVSTKYKYFNPQFQVKWQMKKPNKKPLITNSINYTHSVSNNNHNNHSNNNNYYTNSHNQQTDVLNELSQFNHPSN